MYHKPLYVSMCSAIAEMAEQCHSSRIFAFDWCFLSLMHCFSVTSENIAISHYIAENQIFGLYFCSKHLHACKSKHIDAIGHHITTEFGKKNNAK